MRTSRRCRAASDDASGITGQQAARHSAKAEAADRGTCAEAARAENGPAPGAPRNCFPEDFLPKDGLGFAESVHRMVDLVSVTDGLLRSEDEKMRQRVLEQVLELAFGKNGRAAELARMKEEPEFMIDVPRPERD